MPRATYQGLLSLIGLAALVAVLAWATDGSLGHPVSSDTGTMAVTPRPHGAIATLAVRAPGLSARSEQPGHALDGREPSMEARSIARPHSTTPLYAHCRVYRL